MLDQEEKDDLRVPSGPRRTYWRSASWSARSIPANPNSNPNPRNSQNSKTRMCLPPLQPLSISRRSVDEWPKAGSDDLGEWPQPPSTPSGPKRSSAKPELIPRVPEPVREFQLKKDKLAFFDKECSRIADHIYLGSDAVAKNREILRQNKITHVLNCVGFVCPEYFKNDLVYKTLWLQDSPSEDITSILYDVFDYFEDVREQDGRVLVHCCQGVSRSTSLVIAYLMWRDGQSFEDAFQFVKAARGVTNPNMGFACQLLQCQKRVHAVPASPNSVVRMYRISPHSPYDSLHLVPKMLGRPGALALDSRGSFLVHVPSAIYVWIGKHCNSVMSKHAKAAASQVVRYERAQGPIVEVEEGEEPPEFWDALASVPLSVDDLDKARKVGEAESGVDGLHDGEDQVARAINIGVGNKKVELYDVDFEIFQRALSGGVVPPFPLSGTGSETHLPARENGWGRLRRKFASGDVKELLSAFRLTRDKVQSDNVQNKVMVDACKDDPSVILEDTLSLAASPPCRSPDSFSCDSSTSSKTSSKSPSPSPSDSTSSFTFSPASSSTWSECSSFFSSLPSPRAPELLEPFDVKHVSQLERTCLPCKGSSTSLAERRGSNTPSIMLLPSVDKSARVTKSMVRAWSFSLSAVEEDVLKDSGCHESEFEGFCESLTSVSPSNTGLLGADKVLQFGITNQEEFDEVCLKPNVSIGDCVTSGHHPLISAQMEARESSSPDNLIEGVSDLTCPSLFRWPTFEKVEMLRSGVLDSRSVFLLLTPTINLGNHELKVLYVWVGCDVMFEKGQSYLINSSGTNEGRHIFWEEVGSNFLDHMRLSKDIPVQIIKAGKEPEQFLNYLYFLSSHQAEESSTT